MLSDTLSYFEDIYRKNATANDAYYHICQRYRRIIYNGMRYALIGFGGIIFVHLLLSCYDSYKTKMPMLFIYFPFVREYTLWQVMSLNLFVGTANLLTVFSEPAGNLMIFMVVTNLTMIPMIIESQLNELSQRVELKVANVMDIKGRLMHYIRMHQDFNGQLKVIDECFKYYFIVQFSTSIVSSTLGISIILKVNVQISNVSIL